MFLSHFPKSIATVANTFSLVIISNLILINSAQAFSVTFDNGGFETTTNGSPDGWSTIGDVYTTGLIDGISPTSGANQAIITTGYIEGNYNNPSNPIGNRNDDNSFNFNQSNTNPVSADTNPDADALQEHFGFNSDAFSIPRVGGLSGIGSRTSKEGSGMYQDFSVTLDSGETSFTISFDWSYLTNDGSTDFGGEQDFAFWSLSQYDSNTDTYKSAFDPNDQIQIQVLKSSSGTISDSEPTADNDYVSTFDYAINGRYSYSVSGLTAGETYTYRVGFGVVDVDTLNRTSALMIDNIQAVPFKFSPGLGLLIAGGMIGCDLIRRRLQNYHQKMSKGSPSLKSECVVQN